MRVLAMPKDSLKISVVIPVYNVKTYLEQCIESVIQQTYNNLEIILVDDGSTDGSADICDEYAVTDKRIKAIHKENGGLSSARNRGLKESTGDYICFLDSDDYWDNNSFLSELLAQISDEDLILFRLKKYVEKTGKMIESLPSVKEELPQDKESLIAYLVEHGQFIASACNKMVKRKLLIDNDIYFRTGVTSEDIEWSGKVILSAKSVAYVDIAGYVYRQRENSITSTMTKRNIRDLKNNIKYSIDNAENKIKQTDRMYSVYMSYIAYQFATLILCAHNVKESMYAEVSEMKKYAYVLQYSHNKKVRLFNLIRRMIGFRGLYFAAGLYMKLLFNRI